jgi:hypothetical protein
VPMSTNEHPRLRTKAIDHECRQARTYTGEWGQARASTNGRWVRTRGYRDHGYGHDDNDEGDEDEEKEDEEDEEDEDEEKEGEELLKSGERERQAQVRPPLSFG